jgi:hypothetical protein
MDFYEKALFVKTDVAVAPCGPAQLLRMPFARYASIRTSGEPTLR